MTMEEKIKELRKYCGNTHCIECVLTNRRWDNTTMGGLCLNFENATEEELNQALNLIGEGEQPEAHVEEIEAVDVLLNIIGGKNVFMAYKVAGEDFTIINLNDCTVEKIRKYMVCDNAIFFIIK